MTGLTLTGNGAANGNVLVTNAVGVGTWMPTSSLGVSGSNYWSLTAGAGNVGISTANTVGIGTTSAGAGAGLIVMNGNVGIGTWVPSAALNVMNEQCGDRHLGVNTAINALRNIQLPYTTSVANGGINGIIYKGNVPFISDFNYGYNGTTTTEGANTFVGTLAGNLTMGSTATTIVQASYNTAMGYQALTANTLGDANTAIGYQALFVNNTGYNNAAVGVDALAANTSGYVNSAIGYDALGNIVSGYYDSGIGYYAGTLINGGGNNRTSYNSTYLGSDTSALADGDFNKTVIGFATVGNGSNSVTLGNGGIVKTILQGNVGIGSLAPNGALDVEGTISPIVFAGIPGTKNVGIGSFNPGQLLDVRGTVRMTGLTLAGNGAASGNVLVTNAVGVGTWMPASTLPGTGAANYCVFIGRGWERCYRYFEYGWYRNRFGRGLGRHWL